MNKVRTKDRIGQVKRNIHGSLMEIVEYNNSSDIWVKFEKGNLVHTNYTSFYEGGVKNVYDKSVYGVGYICEGEYKVVENGKTTLQYLTWRNMLKRCYDEKFHIKYPTYKDCTVTDEWHNFQVFAAWYDQNYYEIEDEKMCLDKDIIEKNNKMYSPDTCVFVPKKINSLFVKRNARRGDCPIGVTLNKQKNKYVAMCNNGTYLGTYNNSLQAFNSYKKYKEKMFKEVAEEYKDKIPTKLYDGLIKYKVEIDD